ncbi:MAG: protein kinase, partial [Pirellulaceae bacterium]|nr:protein kinase [Pirellulaceae bacterium]
DAAGSQPLVSLEEIGTEFGDYELLDEIGRGGMGVVYRARQKSLDREVAVKMILAGSLADEESIKRFYVEAQAVGQLRHPNIVQVYEVGQHKGYHFFSMDYIEGQSLAEVMRSRPLSAKECVAYVKTIAEAVHNAHQAGIIHRDLKPANILTDATAQPLITDFGLAKRIKDGSAMTRTGKIMGTPSYMPPEQIGRGKEPISPASDIYALGAILYELLTGRPPFQGESSMDTMWQVLKQEPVAPRVLAPRLHIDLETIALKCLEKTPSQRYESAQALADELGRYLKGQPITARPVTWMERSWRWCKRRPLAATVASVLLILLLVLSIGGPLTVWKQRVLLFDAANKAQTAHSLQNESDQRRDEAIAARNDSEQQRAKVEETFAAKSRQLYIADMRLAGRYWASGDTANVLTILERHRTNVEQDTSHRFEWYYLDRLFHNSMKTLTGQKYSVYCMALSPDGSRLATGGRGGVDIWAPASGKKLININEVPTIYSLAFSPDGKFLAAGGRDFENHETLNIWDWENEKITQTFTDYRRGSDVCFAKVSYSPDGQLITYPGQDGNIKVCQATTGKMVSSLQGHQKSAERPSFSPDGTRIVASSYHSADDQNVKVWDWERGQEVLTLGVAGHVTDVAFGPQGKWLAATVNQAGNKTIRIWEWKDDDKAVFSQVLSGLKRRILCLAFSPDGNFLAASGFDKRVIIWNLEEAISQRVFVGHAKNIYEVLFHPDGDRVLSCSADHSIKIWDRTQRQGSLSLEGKTDGGHGLAFNQDGTRIAMATKRAVIGVWEVATQKKILELSGHLSHILSLQFSPSGKQLVSASADKTVRLWDLRTGKTLFTFAGHDAIIHDVAFSPDGKLIASASADGTARVWNATNGQQWAVFSGHTGQVNGLAF